MTTNIDERSITDEVLGRLAQCPDARLKAIMSSLIRHLHAFMLETRLTEEELMRGIEFLTATGHISNSKRQEFILLSDTLGTSMLAVAMNHSSPPGTTESTVFGPFFVAGAPTFDRGSDISAGSEGESLIAECSVKNLDGAGVPMATIDVWQTDGNGLYDVQHANLDGHRMRGTFHSDERGQFWFKSILPMPYSIPCDGPVGAMLAATYRSPWRPAHIHFMIQAKGYETLITHVFRNGDRYLQSDAVFGVRDSLIGTFRKFAAGQGPTPDQPMPYHHLAFNFVLNKLLNRPDERAIQI